MKWRIKKKKGLIEPVSYRKMKELVRKEIEAEAKALEEKIRNVRLPGEAEDET